MEPLIKFKGILKACENYYINLGLILTLVNDNYCREVD